MKNKKYLFLKEVLITLCLVSTFNVFAHPGRTDANGGHLNHSTGEYHYHTGEYAGRNHSSYNSTKRYEQKKNYESKAETHSESNNRIVSNSNTEKKSNGSLAGFVFIICFCGFYILAILSFITPFITIAVSKFIAWLKKYFFRYKISVLNEKIDRFHNFQNKIFEINQKIFDLQTQSQIPDCYEIGKDNLPKDKQCDSNWGKSFTLYKTISGKKLHTKYNCCLATIPSHVHNYKNYRDFSSFLCKKCANNYVLPDMSWYEIYLNSKSIIIERQITISNRERLRKEIEVLHKKCNSRKYKFLLMFSKKNVNALQEVNKKYKEMHKEVNKSLEFDKEAHYEEKT